MALRIKQTDGGKESAGFAEKNDCTVRATALAADLPYATAHDIAKRSGRTDRRGWYPEKILSLARAEGHLEFVEMPTGSRTGVRLVRTRWGIEHRDCIKMPSLNSIVRRYPTGRYILITRRHAMALIDGVIHDAGPISGPRSRIKTIFEVRPATKLKIVRPEPPQTPKTPPVVISQTQINELWERLNRFEARQG